MIARPSGRAVEGNMPWLVCASPSEDWAVIPPSRHSRHGPRRRGRTQDRTPRTSQRCGPGETYAACRSRSESNGYRQHCGRVAAQYRLAAPKEESRCPESAARCSPSGRVKSAM
nr:MAG TPA_asm: hypothetical protein [Caudoviricetes sp.]